MGKNILAAAEEWLRINHHEIKILFANVLDNNEASNKLFLDSGYGVHVTKYKKILRGVKW